MNGMLTNLAVKQAAAGVSLPAVGGIVGAGVVLLTVTVLLVWKNHKTTLAAYKSASLLALLAGLCLAGVVASYVGGFFGYSVGGVAVTTLGAIGVGIWFTIEVRGHGHHAVRTPVLGLLLGVFLASAGGVLGQAAHQVQNGVVNGVNTSTSTTVGGK